MRNKIQVAQIHLTHPKDQNFTALYAEAFSKQGESVDLFAVIEIADSAVENAKMLAGEYDRLAGLMVTAFKKSYVTAPVIDRDTFEKALGAVNSALSRQLSRGKAAWFGSMHTCLAAIYKNELSLSAIGSAQALLARSAEITLLSEGLAEAKVRPVKIFSNYATGGLKTRDRLLITTGQLFNHLSLDRIQEYLKEDSIGEAAKEIIAALAGAQQASFAAFICEASPSGEAEKTVLPAGAAAPVRNSPKIPELARFAGQLAAAVLGLLWRAVSALGGGLARLAKKSGRKPKYLFAAIGLVAILLLGNVAYGLAKKTFSRQTQNADGRLAVAEQLLDSAEAAIIYKDEKKVAAGAAEAEKILAETSSNKPSAKWQELDARLQALKAKINKVVAVEVATALANFPNVPTDLIRSENGILAWNRDSGSFAFYDFRSGETKTLLANKNTGSLVSGSYIGGGNGFVFVSRDGSFAKLDVAADTLIPLGGAPDPSLAAGVSRGSSLAGFGTGGAARLYLADKSQNQIWRLRANEAGLGAAERWLKEEAALGQFSDMAVDGSIYLLATNSVSKYFNGQKQGFELSPSLPPLSGAAAIFASENTQNIYVLEPQGSRIVIYDKNGQLQKQLASDKFRDAADLYADETAKIIYIISGSELLQMTMP